MGLAEVEGDAVPVMHCEVDTVPLEAALGDTDKVALTVLEGQRVAVALGHCETEGVKEIGPEGESEGVFVASVTVAAAEALPVVQPVDDAVEVTESVGLPVAHAEVEWLCVAVGENVEDAVPEALTVGVTVPVSERVPGCEGVTERVVEPVPHWQGDAEGEALAVAAAERLPVPVAAPDPERLTEEQGDAEWVA